MPASTPHSSIAAWLGVLACLTLGLGVCACGGSGTSRSGAVGANASAHRTDFDDDGDHNDDDAKVLAYGHAAGAPERRVATALVKSYFGAAAAEDGSRACRLLAPLLSETVVETDGHTPALRGRTCAAVMSKLFAVRHRLLAEKSSSLRVYAVRAKEDRMLVVLQFPPSPEARQIEERRVAGRWTIFALLDSIIE
jgi:hypothetical protein